MNFLAEIKRIIAERFSFGILEREEGTCVTFLNPYSYLLLRKTNIKPEELDYVFVDGIALVKFLRLAGLRCERNSFDMTSLAPRVFDYCTQSNKRIFLIGSKDEQIAKAVAQFKERYPTMQIAGYRNGYFTKEQMDQVCQEVLQAHPDVVIAGMGTPMQEDFIINLKKKGFRGTAFTCGGFFHQTAANINYYPKIFDRLNIRWIYRMIDEPKLIKRYFIDYPKFVFVFLYDLLNLKQQSNG